MLDLIVSAGVIFRNRPYDPNWPPRVAVGSQLTGNRGSVQLIEDLGGWPLLERKRRLRAILPRVDDRLVYLDHVERRGVDLFTAVCAHDLEGIVAKWKDGTYHADGVTTSWLKIKNPAYSQMESRHELFERRQPSRTRARGSTPTLCTELRAVAVALHVR
jgi:hypothetical protein